MIPEFPVVPGRDLNNGTVMPQFGLGTWLSPKGDVEAAVLTAIQLGYRHVDAAWVYGNEGEVGNAVAKSIKDGFVKRDQLYLTTKLWNIFHDPKDVDRACDMSLKNLQTDYIDCYLMHCPMHFVGPDDGPALLDESKPACAANGKKPHLIGDADYLDTYKAMEKLVQAGKVKSIGVSNFNQFQLQRIMNNCTIKPVVNQIEVHPYLTNDALVNFCQENDIQVMAYSPLGNPSKPVTRVWDENAKTILQDDKLLAMAKKYNKTVAQICIRFGIQRGLILIPKTTNPARLQENAEVFDFALESGEMDTISAMNQNFRVVELPQNVGVRYYPFVDNYSE